MAPFSRRHVLGLGVGALAAARLGPALADNGTKKLHGLSAFGELKYPADFPNFTYVNPGAPKGGMFSQLVGSGGSVPIVRNTRSGVECWWFRSSTGTKAYENVRRRLSSTIGSQ